MDDKTAEQRYLDVTVPKLGRVERGVLKEALRHRGQDGVVDVLFGELLTALYDLQPSGRFRDGDGHIVSTDTTVSTTQFGYQAGYTGVSRAMHTLEVKGLTVRAGSGYSRYSGVRLTELGAQAAELVREQDLKQAQREVNAA